MNKTFKRLLCLALTVSMLFAMAVVSVSAGKATVHTSRLDTLGVQDEETVCAIVVLEGDAVVDLGVDPQSEAGLKYERSLLAKQTGFLRKAGNLEATYHYTELFNGFAVETTVSELKDIEQMVGVKAVYVANTYSIPDYDVLTEEEINAQWASLLTGAASMNEVGYYGDGVVVAVLDTGINLIHEALQENDLMQNPALDQETVESTETTGGVYVNAKVPYSYDYYDNDTDCTDENGHGSHVSGIIGGYAEDENGDVIFSGAAPAVQLLGMKIFGAEGGTNSAIYFAALEDAYRLGADAVNMSLGSASGFTYDYELEEELYGDIYQKLDDAGIAVFCSAGNDTDMAVYGTNRANQYGFGWTLGDYMDSGVVGTPSTYLPNVSVASADNLYVSSFGVSFDGGETYYAYTDPNEGDWLDFVSTMEGGTYEVVYLPGLGDLSDYEGLDVEGKIVCVNRGEISFQDKIDNASYMGAAACIVVNNVDTMSGMAVEDLSIPAIMIALNAKEFLMSADEVTLSFGMFEYLNPSALQMSSFSSWGTTSDLQFKPQITGIGGSVYSSVPGGTDTYAVYSGTSMSCPNVVGSYAVLLEYLRELYPEASKVDLADVAEDLMLSTAYELSNYSSDFGMYYTASPRQQGAGLVDLLAAVSSPAYLTNPTVSLGADPDMTGVLEMTYELVNLSEETAYYYIQPTVLFEYPYDLFGNGVYYNTRMTMDAYYDYAVSTVLSDGENTTYDEGSAVAIEPGMTAEITVTITVDPEDIAWLADCYPNGFFLDGFVNFYDYEDYLYYELNLDAAPSVLFHGSFISYCGDWTAAPALEQLWSSDLLDVLAWMDENGYLEAGYGLADGLMALGYEMNASYNEAYLYSTEVGYHSDLGANPFSSNYNYTNSDRNAFSTDLTDADGYFMNSVLFMPTVLRNCRHLIMTVTDAETGEVYYVDDTEYVAKDAPDHDTGAYTHRSQYLWDGINANTGEFVPSGTKAIITFESVLDYEGAEKKVEYVTEVTVDYTAPELYYEYIAETKTLTVTVTDSEYLATLVVYGDETDVSREEYADDEAGMSYTYTFDLSEYTEEYLYIEAADYATNLIGYEIWLGANASNFPVEVIVEAPEGICVDIFGAPQLYGVMEFAVSAEDGYCLTDDYTVTINGVEKDPYFVYSDGAYDYVYNVDSMEPIVITVTGVMEHDFQPVTVKEATCDSIGYVEYYCTNCGIYDHGEWVDAHGHTPAEDYVVVSLPSCEDCVVSVLYCTECGDIIDLISEAGEGHTPGDAVVLVEPTCTETGYAVRYCADCGEIVAVELLEATGHTAGEWETVKNATYTEAGEKVQHCTECGEEIAREAIAKLDGVPGDVTGDGEVSLQDYMLVRLHLLQKIALEGDEFVRGDINGDGEITLADCMLIRYALLGNDD